MTYPKPLLSVFAVVDMPTIPTNPVHLEVPACSGYCS